VGFVFAPGVNKQVTHFFWNQGARPKFSSSVGDFGLHVRAWDAASDLAWIYEPSYTRKYSRGVVQMRELTEVQPELEKLKQKYEKLQEEQALLAKAVAFMGLNPTAIVDELRPGGDPILRALPFRMVSVVLDKELAAKSEISENTMAYVIEVLGRVRMPRPG
jgi:hypothetical protein